MNLNQYNERLQLLAQQSGEKAVESVLVPAANALLAGIINRVVNDGRNSSDQNIGSYSSKPSYYEQNQFVKKSAFKPQGKTGKSQTKAGKMHKSMYLPGGYKQLRDIQGRPTDKVNLNYSGSTMASYQLQPLKDAVVIGFVNEKSSRVRKALEKKYGRSYYATQKEMDNYNKEVAEESKKLTLQILKGA